MSDSVGKLDLHDEYEYGFNDGDVAVLRMDRGLSREVVEEISRIKQEPKWMRDFRLHALDV
jgi:Fe-S cluster assembly protein SufB